MLVVASMLGSVCKAVPWGDAEPLVMDSALVNLAHFLPILSLAASLRLSPSEHGLQLPLPGFLYPILILSHSHHIHCALIYR